MPIAKTPEAPYYAVILTSTRTAERAAFDTIADAMAHHAAKQPGFLGIESAHDPIGITVSYWESLEAIAAWKRNSAHLVAQERGRDLSFQSYKTRICRVERDYGFERES
ncbi:MAG: antibiotic biosynthesis monooxygenase [Terracidiphilus sp.]|jgi:heme-degrading monooxygenase HmoA